MRRGNGFAKPILFGVLALALFVLAACNAVPSAPTQPADVIVVTATGAPATQAPPATTAPTEAATAVVATAAPTEAAPATTAPTEAATQAPSGSGELGMSKDNPVTSNEAWTWVTNEANGFVWVLVPTGCYTMGWNSGFTEETPESQQCFDTPFWITQTEITNKQYGSQGPFAGDDVPRTNVTWSDAAAFCESKGGRLPTEREWEYAAKGPSNARFPMGDTLQPGFIIHAGNAKSAVKVGSQPDNASWVGAYDMLGNAREWVSSGWEKYPPVEGDTREKPPTGGGEQRRVVRGGSYLTGESFLRNSFREFYQYNVAAVDIGFRCAMNYQP